ncbi:MAG: DUF4349 domain-containing protein [Candidatus Limnocylindrales bacterium]
MTTNESDPVEASPEPDPEAEPPSVPRRALGLRIASRLVARLGRGRLTGILAVLAVVALVAGAYVVGSPASADQSLSSLSPDRLAAQPAATAAPAAVPITDQGLLSGVDQSGAGSSITANPTQAGGQSQLFATIDASQIVKTGQMTLEVTDVETATAQAQAAIVAMGGYVDSSTKSGTGPDATATITFRLPVAKWDQGLAAMRKIGTRDLFEQTSSSDVTSQVIDLNARIDNLKTTETALQAIMTRSGSVADILAVETQLSDTQGQIEELTAERDNLANQAAMSTLAVTLHLPTATVTTQATQDWTLGSQVDQAVAALVRVGQGLATMAVWLVIVVLPVALGVLVLLAIALVARRIARRGRRNAVAGA